MNLVHLPVPQGLCFVKFYVYYFNTLWPKKPEIIDKFTRYTGLSHLSAIKRHTAV